ncbi:MFS transporter, partial [Catellatospora sp. NPDC049133]|uniref:MFS transporter n=1 Tax=Catellatospora sp. NPDC049133 TaxID=3155499 RepID=UPI003410C156
MTTALAPDATQTTEPAQGWWAARFGGLPRTFWVLFTGIGLARLGFFVVPFLGYWLTVDRGLNPAQIGVVMTSFGAGWALSMPIGGWLADRLGRRTVIIASALGAASAYLALGAVHGYGPLIATAFFVGATFDLYRPAVQAAMTDAVDPEGRGRALGLLYLVMNASRMLSCALGGLLAERAFGALF